MNVLKLIAVFTLITGSVAVVSGTGAFSAVDADRMTDVGVANDENALLGLTTGGGTIDPGDEVTLYTVTNQFDGDIDSVDVTVTDSGPFNNVVIQGTPDSLAAGESGDITATIGGPPGTSGTIEILIVADGGSSTVEMTREVSVEIESTGPRLCTIENDDRIGNRTFFAEGEEFNCKIVIDAENPYEVGFENSTATGGFEFTSGLPLQGFEFDSSTIGDDAEITVDSNLVDDIEIDATKIDGDLNITIEGNADADIIIKNADIDGDVNVDVDRLNSEIEIVDNTVSGDVRVDVDSQTGAGSVTVERNG